MKRLVFIPLALACVGSWLIGRCCHALGLHHTGGHILAEVAVLFTLGLVALVLDLRRRR